MEFVANVETPNGDFIVPWLVGVGHVEGYRQSNRYTEYQARKFDAGIRGYKPVATDLIAHVLCLADCLELTFGEWAENLGLSDDSIQARWDYIHHQEWCIIIRRILGNDFEKIREWAQEQ
jgi:hypothetical protein